MTVQELREALEQYPNDAEVVVRVDGSNVESNLDLSWLSLEFGDTVVVSV